MQLQALHLPRGRLQYALQASGSGRGVTLVMQAKPALKAAEQSTGSTEAGEQQDSQAEARQAAAVQGGKSAPKTAVKGSTGSADGSEQAPRDSSKTVFVRSLPPDVSQDQLNIAFRKFGKLRACR